MDTNWLMDLQALSETLNFSRAAQKRNITQPAFGRRIRALEDWAGAPLVDRSSHRLSLTPAGRAMLAAAGDVTRRLDQARREVDQSRAATATLTFAATHALSFSFFPAWIRSLGPAASAQAMRLLSDNMNHCERIMLAGEAQFLLCHHHPVSPMALPPEDFHHLVLARDRLVPVAVRSPDGRARFTLPGTPAHPVPQVGFEPTSGMGRILAAALLDRAEDLHLSPVLSSHLAMVLKALAIESKGVAWIPHSLAQDELGPQGRLADAGDGRWQVQMRIALFRPRARMSAIAERFWGLAQEATAAAGPLPVP